MITTNRCVLARPEEEDRAEVRRLRTDPAVRRYLGGPASEADVERFFAKLEDNAAIHWAVRKKGEPTLMGLVTLDEHGDDRDAEISYEFLPEFWGKGYATESVGAVLDYANNALRLPRVVAETQADNLASRRLLERLGMELERTLLRHGAVQVLYSTALR